MRIVSLFVSSAVLSACTSGVERTAALQAAFDVIDAEYRSFEVHTADLAATSQGVCDDITAERVAAIQDAWWASRGTYKRADMAGFGPVVEQPDRLGPLIDFWPARSVAVDELIASDAALDAEAFSTLGAATRGLPSIEYVLYQPDVVESWVNVPRNCTFVRAATEDVHASAVALVIAWNLWEDRLVLPDGEPYAAEQDVLNEWANRVAFAAEDIRLEKLAAPMGMGGDDIRPDALESRYSRRSVQDAVDTLDGAHLVLLAVLPLADDPELVSRAEQVYSLARARLLDISEPAETTMAIEPEIVERAQQAVQAYQVLVQVDIAQALSVTVVFNDNDGD
ncbi:MAG: putative lipoprotein [Myxococcota bacterium]|jgi:predicted lipoprotein